MGSSRYYYELWRDMVLAEVSPGDWRTWLEHFRAVAADRSRGIAGVPDEALYDPALAYVAAVEAPRIVRLALIYQQSLATWDFHLASRTLDQILSETNRLGWSMYHLVEWIPATLLVEGGVLAKLAVGDKRGARYLYEALETHYQRPRGHLRRMLIESLLD